MDATLANSMADPIISVMDVYNTKSMIDTQIVTVYRIRRPAPPPLPLWQTPLWHQVAKATAFLSGTISLQLWHMMPLWHQVVQAATILNGIIYMCTHAEEEDVLIPPYETFEVVKVEGTECICVKSIVPDDLVHAYVGNNIGQINLDNYNTCNLCNYVFDLSLDSKCSFKDGFSILHLNSRSFNKNRDFIEIFISNLKHTFSIIALSETW